MKLCVVLTHKVLALALKHFLCSFAPDVHQVEKDRSELEGVDVVVTDYQTLISGALAPLPPTAKILLLDTGLSPAEQRIGLLFFRGEGDSPNGCDP